MRKFVHVIQAVAMAAIVLLGLSSGPTLSQSTNAQLLALITSQLPSGSLVPITNFRTVLDAIVNSTNVSGTSCPTTSLTEGQPWINTTNTPAGVILNVFDGANCVPWALLNTTAHTMTLLGSAGQSPGQNLAGRFGSMDVFQRGAGGSASIAVAASTTAYTVDGCYLATGTGEASTVAAVAGIANGSNKAASVTRNSGQTGTAQMTFGCPLDTDELTLAHGYYVALSFSIQAGANFSSVSGTMTANVVCGTGTPVKQIVGYAGQTTVATLSQNLTPGGSVQRLQVTSSAVVPTNCAQMEVQWTWSPTGTAGAADSLTIDDVQLEVVAGPQAVASPFQALDFNTQLVKARGHYYKTFSYGTAPAQNAGTSGALYTQSQGSTANNPLSIQMQTRMRVAPSVTTYNPSASNANCRDITGSADLTATFPDTSNVPVNSDRASGFCAAAGAASHAIALHATFDSGI